MKQLRVVHVTTSVSREGGGLFSSVRQLSLETAKNNVDVSVLATTDKYTEEDENVWLPLTVRTFRIFGPRRFAYSPGLSRSLQTAAPDIVHLHGVWQYPTVAVLRWAQRTGKPYLVSVHGMLEPWALQHSRRKKALVNFLFQKKCLLQATCLRATSRLEAESIRKAAYKNPIALIPNGVRLPSAIPLREHTGQAGRKKRALFLSRIHPKKGLLNLVLAWDRIRPPDWEIVLVGPDEGGHLAEVMSAVRANGLEGQIRYEGEIWDEAAKWKCYAEADLFVLPTYSENFGLVIAEALGCGVPVITTRAAPWEELETHRCGWWIDVGLEPLVIALREATALPAEHLREMGARGKELVQERYAWEPIGRQMAAVYDWMAGRGSKPGNVID